MCHPVVTVHTYVPKTTGFNHFTAVINSNELHKFKVLHVRGAPNFIQVQRSRAADKR